MKIVVAPDSFKGCLLSPDVAAAIGEGVRRAAPCAEIVEVPVADGGEGTVYALVSATGGKIVSVPVEGPLGEPTNAAFGLLGDGTTAAIEMAAASGLPLVPPDKRDPTKTSTYGTGQLIRAALDMGAQELIVGIGGSATNDAGCGMAQALGVRFLDATGTPIERVTGGRLLDVARIDVSDRDKRLAETRIRVACDVDNPLYGPTGAARVYAPQKGATPEQVELLDRGLRHIAEVIQRDLGLDIANVPGAGAAGGLGAGLMAFCGAQLEPGIRIVLEAVRLAEKMQSAELCITGEGRIDEQTAYGKAPAGVAEIARRSGAVVVALGGSIALETGLLHDIGFSAVFSIVPGPMPLDEAMRPDTARALLAAAGEQVVRLFMAARRP
ncbi:MAG: glycerate kinase [Armatimonadetes bacterium]|nr:glycerate kinase [Armatimonadota bacterium]